MNKKLQPIAGVMVVGSDRTVFSQTDEAGNVTLEMFSNSDTIYFQHPAYRPDKTTSEKLASRNWKMVLEENVVQLDETVVLVNRWEQQPEEIPQQITSISPSAIALRNPGTAADALEQTGEVFVQRSQLGGGSPMIRGFAANSVLIVVDGIRMNNAIFRSGNLQNVISIDPNLIGEAEVVFGPSSVIYGSDALGGVMDFHTFKPSYSLSANLEIKGQSFIRYSSAAHEKTGNIRFDLAGKRWASLTNFTYSSFGDLRAGNGRPASFPDFGKRPQYVVQRNGQDTLVQNTDVNRQVPSGYRQWNMMQKFRYRLTDYADLTYGFLFSTTSDIPRYDRLIEESERELPRNAEWYYGPQRWMMNYLKADFYNANRWYDAAKITIGYQQVQESRNDRRFQRNLLRSRTEDVGMWTINLDADRQWNAKHQLFYGGEYVFNDVQSSAFQQDIESGEQEPSSTRYPDGGSRYQSAALYSSYQWNPNPKTTLSAGIRYSYVWLTSEFADTSFFNFPYNRIDLGTGALSGSLGLTYRPDERWQFSTVASSGFRAPNIDDIGKVFDSEPGNVVVPNPNLSPEYSYNAEVGGTFHFSDQWKINGVLYGSLLRNAMVRRDFTFSGQDSILYDGVLSNVQAITNTGQAYIWGYSLQLEGDLSPYWKLRATFSDNTGRDTEENQPLRHVTPWFGRTSVSYKRNKWQGEFFLRYNGSVALEDLAPSEQNKPHLYTEEGSLAWFTLNLISSYEILPKLRLQLGLENILDKHYRPYASGISAPGINAIVAVRGSF
ncbi:TonB-dependent receptor plug domain-containing protein [Tunicatimonas pelagia]|uniref:TonB-dependent receptor plug domain-containing protein n=1 Tax=Tunicatimonas pelagia TaxID=931531 RepID=UPI002665BDB7|nr:TonB-dependent receptor [Tunicatimonas pelagia]WKN42683.1 TonB-dependent receptor [Tunicatimonas pelagia]